MPAVLSALALGGNLGDVEAAFTIAIEALSVHFDDLKVAPLYRTTAVSEAPAEPPQNAYLNSAIVGRTTTSAEELLALAQALERQAGRQRGSRWASRPLDLDLLFWGERTSTLPELMLPHPRVLERRFVLQPLSELIPDHRIAGRTIAAWLRLSAPDPALTVLPWRRPPSES